MNQDKVTGKITKFIFNKDDYLIGLINTGEREVIFKGAMMDIAMSEEISLIGNWIHHPKYGQQLEVTNWERPIPETKQKAAAYLASSFVKGCGERQAWKIVDALGDQAIPMIMDQGAEVLSKIKGIGSKRAGKIAQSIFETFEVQNLVNEFSPYGMPPEIILKAYQEYGSNAKEELRRNPYLVSNHHWLSFQRVDDIALKLGKPVNSSFRIQAAINYILAEKCHRFGHSFLYEKDVVDAVTSVLLANRNEQRQIDATDIASNIYDLEDKTIIIDGEKLYPKRYYAYETSIADKVNQLVNAPSLSIKQKKIDTCLKEYQLETGVQLGEEQKNAISKVLVNNLSILTGNPGTGKTTVVKAIIYVYRKLNPKKSLSLSAPTGRASRKLEQATGHEAFTNHKLLGYKQEGGFEYDHQNKLSHDFYIIDEMSMVDLHMAHSVLRAIDRRSQVLIIGDTDQLPSVNAGNVLEELLKTDIPSFQLTEIYRQAKGSQIIMNAQRVNQGQEMKIDHTRGDMYFVNKSSDESIGDGIIQSMKRFLELGYAMKDILILTPMKKGSIGTFEMNQRIQQTLNPKHPLKDEAKYGKKTFRIGDRIIQTKNNPELGVSNGDIGTITSIYKTTIKNDDNEQVEVDIIESDFDGRTIKHAKKCWNEIELGYSITIHKSQGGQAPIVIMPMSMSHFIMLQRNLVYTGMTRAEEKLVFIGSKQACNRAILNKTIHSRHTSLSDRINEMASNRGNKKTILSFS